MKNPRVYGYVQSKYPLWLVRDLKWALRDQVIMMMILFFTLLIIADLFLSLPFGYSKNFWIGNLVVSVIILIVFALFWKSIKKMVADHEGTYILHAKSEEKGYYHLKDVITNVLDEAKLDYIIENGGFQAILRATWCPPQIYDKSNYKIRIVHMEYDITRANEIELRLNSLCKFPGLEEKLIPELERHFSIDLDGKITVRA